MTTLWERVDDPVLRWVASLPSALSGETHDLELRDPGLFGPIPWLNSREVDASLRRLRSHGLIDGQSADAMGNTSWLSLRVTAQGLIVLGEWPDLDRVATAASVHGLLRALAQDASEAERPALRRAAGSVARVSDDVLRGSAIELAHAAGKGLAGG